MTVRFLICLLFCLETGGKNLLQKASSDKEAAGMVADQALRARRVAVNDGSSEESTSNEAEDHVNDSNITQTHTTSTVSTTTSIPVFVAARISGYVEFAASGTDEEAVELAAETSLADALGLGAWQLNVSALETVGTWHVPYTIDLGPEQVREVLLAGHQARVDSGPFAGRLSQELIGGSSLPERVRDSFDFRVFARLEIQEIDPQFLNSTSTTLTSLTQTTTTTSQTSLVSLKLLAATVREPYESVVFTFNFPCHFTRPVDTNGCSSSAFSPGTWASLGHLPRCRWDGRHLEVFFGRGPTASLGQTLSTSMASFDPSGNVAFVDSPAFQAVMSAEEMGHVMPRLSHPTAVSSCSQVSFTVLGSRGGAGRALSAKWFIGPPTFRVVREALQETVEVASSEGARTLEFSPAVFSLAVQNVRIQLGEISYAKTPVQVNITAQVSNWLGAASNISGIVTVLKEDKPLPVVVAASPTVQRRLAQDEISFSILTLTSKNMSSCVGPVSNAESNDVVVEWEYRPNIERLAWQKVSMLQNLSDTSKTPNSARFAPFSFPPNTSHQFRALAHYEGTSVARRPNITFNLSIPPREPPVARIQGPSEVGASCPFTLNASLSRDDWSLDSALVYRWTCSSAESDCGISNFEEGHLNRTDGMGASGAVMHVDGGQLMADPGQ